MQYAEEDRENLDRLEVRTPCGGIFHLISWPLISCTNASGVLQSMFQHKFLEAQEHSSAEGAEGTMQEVQAILKEIQEGA